MQLHDGAQQQRTVTLAALLRGGRHGSEADEAFTEPQDVQRGDRLTGRILEQVTHAADMVRILILVGAILIKGLPVLPRIVAESEDGAQVFRLHQTQSTHGRETLAPVFDQAFEHRLRTNPRARRRIIIQAAIDHLGREVLGMRRHPEPEVMVALVVAIEGPRHGGCYAGVGIGVGVGIGKATGRAERPAQP